MGSKKPVLLIPVENQVRELDAKLLLAYIAGKHDLTPIIGFKRDIESRIASFPRSIGRCPGKNCRAPVSITEASVYGPPGGLVAGNPSSQTAKQ